EGDRMELLEPGGAAHRSTARSAAVESLGLLAPPDLTQLDAGAEARRQVLDQLAKVDALIGGEEEGVAVAVEGHLDFGQFHQESARVDARAAVLEGLGLLLAVVILLVEILLFGLADDLAGYRAGTLELDEEGILEEHRPQTFTEIGLDH